LNPKSLTLRKTTKFKLAEIGVGGERPTPKAVAERISAIKKMVTKELEGAGTAGSATPSLASVPSTPRRRGPAVPRTPRGPRTPGTQTSGKRKKNITPTLDYPDDDEEYRAPKMARNELSQLASGDIFSNAATPDPRSDVEMSGNDVIDMTGDDDAADAPSGNPSTCTTPSGRVKREVKPKVEESKIKKEDLEAEIGKDSDMSYEDSGESFVDPDSGHQLFTPGV
jgi:hypothetical protein